MHSLLCHAVPLGLQVEVQPVRAETPGRVAQALPDKPTERGYLRHAVALDHIAKEDGIDVALQQLDPLWDELFPAEQARSVTLLVERVDIGTNGLNFRLRMDGLGGLAREMLSGSIGAAA